MSQIARPLEASVKFVDDLERLTLMRAISLVWIHEIHIDRRYEHSRTLPDLIKHEQYHHTLLWKRVDQTSKSRRFLMAIWNNVWDQYDVYRLLFKWYIQRLRYGKETT